MTENQYPLPHVGTYIGHFDITGERLPLAEATALVSRLDLHGVLRLIVGLNNIFLKIDAVEPSLQRDLQRQLLAPNLQAAFARSLRVPQAPHPVVFHRQQQLFMLRLALTSCAVNGGADVNSPSVHDFGKACLIVNDYLGVTNMPPPDDILANAAALLPVAELPSDLRAAGVIGRAANIWLQLATDPALTTLSDWTDIPALFENTYGVSLREFIFTLYAIYAYTLAADPTSAEPLRNLVLDKRQFVGQTRLSQEVLDRVLDISGLTVAEYGNELALAPRQSARWDFTTFQRHPLIEVEANLFACFDQGFLLRYLVDGIYLLIQDAMPAEQQGAFASLFGKMYAAYVEGVLRRIYGNRAGFTLRMLEMNLRFENGDEVTDAVVDDGESWVMMEVKGSLLSPRAKYSGLASALQADLSKKFVAAKKGTRDTAKGVSQLAKSIKRLLAGDTIKGRPADMSACRTIYPVVVSYESALAAPLIQRYLDEEFNRQLGRTGTKPRIRPLAIITTAALEAYAGISRQKKLSILLEEYHTRPGNLWHFDFGQFLMHRYGEELDLHNTAIGDSYEEIHRQVLDELFGQGRPSV